MKGKDNHGPWLDYYLSKHFKCESINNAIPGSSNSRIIRTSMRDALNLRPKRSLIVLGLSFLFRTEVWIPNHIRQFDKFDGDFTSFQVPQTATWYESLLGGKRILKDEKLFPKEIVDYLHSFYKIYNEEAEYLNLLKDILGFVGFCKSNAIDYIIFPAAEKLPPSSNIDIHSIFLTSFQKEIENDDHIFPLNNFCFNSFSLENKFIPYDFDEFGINGHHSSAAFEHFAKYLIRKYNW